MKHIKKFDKFKLNEKIEEFEDSSGYRGFYFTKENIPSKSEMKKIFKEHNLQLGFPQNSKNGGIVTDWNLLYHKNESETSDLKEFIDIIESEYSDKYFTSNSSILASVNVYKKDK